MFPGIRPTLARVPEFFATLGWKRSISRQGESGEKCQSDNALADKR
jgi:hypothetical protein